uniref:Secreted protein n=1 Tax=Aegilops tauschii subsp. strangulata TaxID=200361 RepID=A0A453RJC0_AEGTS
MWPSLQAHIWIWSTLFHPIFIYSIPAIDSNSLFSNCTLKAKPKKDHINYSSNSRINHGIQMEDRKRRQFKPNGQTNPRQKYLYPEKNNKRTKTTPYSTGLPL